MHPAITSHRSICLLKRSTAVCICASHAQRCRTVRAHWLVQLEKMLPYNDLVALQEAKITLVRLFQQYTFELKPGQEPLELRNTITLSPKKGVIVKPIPHKHSRMEE